MSVIASTLLAVAAATTAPAADSLQPIVQCVVAGPLKGVDIQRRTDAGTTRTVALPGGGAQRQVSVLDGYRVMLATANGQYFVNLKIERSAPGQAEADRAVIREQMQALVRQGPAGAPPLLQRDEGGVELLGLNQPSLDSGSLGFYTLFVPSADLVVTLYLLNQAPARREFKTYADYERLRDQALSQVRACLR